QKLQLSAALLGQYRHQEGHPKQHVRGDLLDVAGVETGADRHLGCLEEITRSPMDHPARVPARADSEILFFDEGDLEAAQREVASDACTVHASADDDHVKAGLRSRRSVHALEGRTDAPGLA